MGSIRPSMLITVFRRQSMVLRLGYSHAVMHANRLFLLGNLSSRSQPQIMECVDAATDVLQNVDGMAKDGAIFHAFWWTQYVTFCALLVAYIWDIQQRRRNAHIDPKGPHAKLMVVAERCQRHLANATATNSPSRRYAVILEEFRLEAMDQVTKQGGGAATRVPEARPEVYHASHTSHGQSTSELETGILFGGGSPADSSGVSINQNPSESFSLNLLDNWDTTDWLNLDSSAFGLFDTDPFAWIPGTV